MRRINTFLSVLVVLMLVVTGYSYAARVGVTKIEHRGWRDKVLFRDVITLRTVAALTASYVSAPASGELHVEDYNQVEFLFDITQGSLDSFEFIVWHGIDIDADGTIEWYRQVTQTVGAGTITLNAAVYDFTLSGNVEIFVELPSLGHYMRVQVKGTDSGGVYNDNTCAVYMLAGNI